VLAKNGAFTVMCGSKGMPWDDGFARFLLDLGMTLHIGAISNDTKTRIQQTIRTVRFIEERRRQRTEKVWRPLSSLFHLLLRTRFTDASNVTDYVAAVLGLAPDWNIGCGLSPAYGSPGE
jgi:hypothetical protein